MSRLDHLKTKDCKKILEYLQDYVEEKLDMDKSDCNCIQNPLLFIKKLGAMDTLYDIRRILDEQFRYYYDMPRELKEDRSE